MEAVSTFFKRKDVVISAHRYGIDAMGAMAQGLFASLLIGISYRRAYWHNRGNRFGTSHHPYPS